MTNQKLWGYYVPAATGWDEDTFFTCKDWKEQPTIDTPKVGVPTFPDSKILKRGKWKQYTIGERWGEPCLINSEGYTLAFVNIQFLKGLK